MLRTWPALLAWGAGLIHLAIGAQSAAAGARWPAAALLVPMLVVGVAELGWGVAVFRAGRIVRGKAAAIGSIVAVVLAAAALVGGAPVLAVAVSSALAVVGGSMAARASTTVEAQPREGERAARPSRSRTAGMVLGAVLVAGLVTPVLAQTDAGMRAGMHHHGADMQMPLMDPHAHH